jgi:hypothetical protein
MLGISWWLLLKSVCCWGIPSTRTPERTTLKLKYFYKYWEGKLKGESKMLLNELMRVDYATSQYDNYAPKKLMSQIEFVADGNETSVISKRLQQKRIKPTLDNIKRYLMQCLLKPLDELPLPERTIIMRSGRPERFE